MRYYLVAAMLLVGIGVVSAAEIEITDGNRDRTQNELQAAQEFGYTIRQTYDVIAGTLGSIYVVEEDGKAVRTYYQRKSKAVRIAELEGQIASLATRLTTLNQDLDIAKQLVVP